jgi:Spy/CpxP family protein refolding chaperone
MFKSKIALLSAASLLCAGLAIAQTADSNPSAPPQMRQQHHPDFAAMHKSMCEDHQAGAAARLAFVEVKLGLTDAQKPLFAKWRQAVLDNATKQKSACLAEAPKTDAHQQPTVLEREAKAEEMLTAKLQMLQSTKAPLKAFYDSLTDAQKETFNHMHHEGRGHGHHGGWGGHGGEGGDHPFMNHPQ